MANVTKRTISLDAEQTDYIDRLVASGTFASDHDVISAAFSALQMQDSGLDATQESQVIAAFDALQADPARAIPAQTVFDDIRSLHAKQHRKLA
jgi:antitoxin ParD1/3/4